MKPAIFSASKDPILESEWRATFPFHNPGGSPYVYMPIGSGYTGAQLQPAIDAALARGQILVFWLYPPTSVLKSANFNPAAVATHPNFVDAAKRLRAFAAHPGAVAIGQLHGEFDQWAKFGGAAYRKCFEDCRRILQAPINGEPARIYVSWDKGPFMNGPADGSKALSFDEWEPEKYDFLGVHGFSKMLGIDPSTLIFNSDLSNYRDNRRFIEWAKAKYLVGGKWTKPWTMLEGGFTHGDVTDPDQAERYMTLLVALWDEIEVRVTCAPINDKCSGDGGDFAPDTGRYCPGAHNPPGALLSPPWVGSPKMCAIMAKLLQQPGRFIQAGDPVLSALAVALPAP